MDAARRLLEPIVLALVLAAALSRPLLTPAIAHHGEAREGLVVQGIVDTGNWVLPRRNGELPSKPPLFHWIAAAATILFGFSDAAVRLPSALAAWVVACGVLALGRSFDRTTGWLAVGVLFGMAPFLTSAIEARVDMVLSACVTTTLVAFFLWYRTPTERGWRAWVYLAMGAGVLAKGPVGAALPAFVIVVFLAVERDLGRLRALWSWRLVGVLLVLAVGWYVLAALSGGRDFVALQLIRENWQRLVGSHEFRRHARGSTLRPTVQLVTQYLPWALALVWCAVRWLRGVQTEACERFLHVWWVAVLVLFTIAAGKRPVYLLPAAPPLALLAGHALAQAARSAASTRRLVHVAVALAIFDAGLLATEQGIREHKARRQSLPAFAADVARLVPGVGPVCASHDIRWTDRMVLAYRLRRPVPPRDAGCDGAAPYLVPRRHAGENHDAGTMVAISGDHDDDFALAVDATPPALHAAVGQ